MPAGSSHLRSLETALLVAAGALLAAGLSTPVVRLERGLSSTTYSVVGGAISLARSGDLLLGLFLLGFSVAFPVAKLALVARAWLRPRTSSPQVLERLSRLGKWSLLDAYVVVVFVGAMRLGILAGAEPRYGIYLFAVSVVVSMLATHRVLQRLTPGDERQVEPDQECLRSIPGRLGGIGAAALLAGGLGLPLMQVEKWLFWSHEYSLVDGLSRLLETGELLLFALTGVFVVLAPIAHAVSSLVLRWQTSAGRRTSRLALGLQEWSMVEVFALALLIVVAKASVDASVTPRAGLWCLLGAAVLSAIDARDLRAALRGSPAGGDSPASL